MNELLSKEILLRLTEDEYERLAYVSQKLGLSVSETLRAIVPNVLPAERKTVAVDELDKASVVDSVAVEHPVDNKELERLIDEMEKKKSALTLAREIRRQLIEEEGTRLSYETATRLARWANPRRLSKREITIRPIARQISQLLWGKVIARVD
jgi:hypothetical protein